MKVKNMIGLKYGMLTVLQYVGQGKAGKQRMYLCKCDCGKTKTIRGSHLRDVKIKSCGCFGIESRIRHGLLLTTTGKRLYSVWQSMKQRCFNSSNPEYKNYGSRGITVCKEWQDNFETFYNWAIKNGYAENQRLSIDRINNDKGYSPDNCRWATIKEQNYNKRGTTLLTICGVTKGKKEWKTFAKLNKVKGVCPRKPLSNEAFIEFIQAKIEQGEITL